jgi:CubicO group peptidase (beta-lactamase class C family)
MGNRAFNKAKCLIGILVFIISYSNCLIDPAKENAIDELIKATLLDKNVPAVGLSIVKDGTVYTKGYGFRNLNNSAQADNSTLFFIGFEPLQR